MHDAYDKDNVFRPESCVSVWIAPDGHTRAHSPHAVQRMKSMIGNPNDTCVPKGFVSVTTPVFRLLARIVNILVASGADADDQRRTRRARSLYHRPTASSVLRHIPELMA